MSKECEVYCREHNTMLWAMELETVLYKCTYINKILAHSRIPYGLSSSRSVCQECAALSHFI